MISDDISISSSWQSVRDKRGIKLYLEWQGDSEEKDRLVKIECKIVAVLNLNDMTMLVLMI